MITLDDFQTEPKPESVAAFPHVPLQGKRPSVEDEDIKRTFGLSVRIYRLRLGISQEELGRRADLHRTYVSDVERGERNVSLESIEKFARALDISIPSLFS